MTGETILIVEDNDLTRRGIQIVLEMDGYRVIPAIHGLDALERMKAKVPDLILSDIAMPEMDGFAFFSAARARPEWVSTPFIFLTALGGRDDVFEGIKLGAEDYLVKPVDRHELLETVRTRLARSKQVKLAQLQQAYQTSLITFSSAIELRDNYTQAHVERVMEYTLLIAEQLGLARERIQALKFGSILHDIGKLYIREETLSKPGPLSEEEWIEVKRHPIIGAELIMNIPYLSAAIPIIRHHHERWDGQGYPDGLAGESIPLEARIVAVADSLDAISTLRRYQPALSPQEAYDEILGGSGTRYDPRVVAAFQAAWEEIKQRMG